MLKKSKRRRSHGEWWWCLVALVIPHSVLMIIRWLSCPPPYVFHPTCHLFSLTVQLSPLPATCRMEGWREGRREGEMHEKEGLLVGLRRYSSCGMIASGQPLLTGTPIDVSGMRSSPLSSPAPSPPHVFSSVPSP